MFPVSQSLNILKPQSLSPTCCVIISKYSISTLFIYPYRLVIYYFEICLVLPQCLPVNSLTVSSCISSFPWNTFPVYFPCISLARVSPLWCPHHCVHLTWASVSFLIWDCYEHCLDGHSRTQVAWCMFTWITQALVLRSGIARWPQETCKFTFPR